MNWAFWITGFWGFALAFHALASYVDAGNPRQQYLDEERRRHAPRG